MKIRPTTVLLVLASVTAFTASAHADAPEQHVFGMGGYAPSAPRVEMMNVEHRSSRHDGGRRARRETAQRQTRERTRSARRHERAERRHAEREQEHAEHRHAEHHRGRYTIRAVAVHEDGAKVASLETTGSVQASIRGGSGSIVAEARRWLGTNPTSRRTLWCARFMNFVLRRVGLAGTSSDLAQSFASYGHRLSGPKIGAIAVMHSGRGGGHVGVVSGFDRSGNPIIISGNHSHRVAEAVYSRGRIYAYVTPGH
jgi:uncharacterized protein (TIGR02594 family)